MTNPVGPEGGQADGLTLVNNMLDAYDRLKTSRYLEGTSFADVVHAREAYDAERQKLLAFVDQLAREGAQDTRRLDWLEQSKRDIIAPMFVPELGITPWHVTADGGGDEGVATAATARAAIDAAISSRVDGAGGVSVAPNYEGVSGGTTEEGRPSETLGG